MFLFACRVTDISQNHQCSTSLTILNIVLISSCGSQHEVSENNNVEVKDLYKWFFVFITGCAHTGLTGPGGPPEDGEINEMTLPSRHMIRNSGPRGLVTSTLPLGHGGSPQYWITASEREETFVSSQLGGQSGARTRHLRLPKQTAVIVILHWLLCYRSSYSTLIVVHSSSM